MALGVLLVACAVFAAIAVFVSDPNFKKASFFFFAICGIVFVVLVLLAAFGQMSVAWPGA